MRKKSRKAGGRPALERGFTLLEVVLSAALLFLTLVAFLSIVMAQAASVEMEKRIKRANVAADDALERLTSTNAPLQTTGGSFTFSADNAIAPSACSAAWCDELLVDDSGARVGDSQSSSLAGGSMWGIAYPQGAHREFIRRWSYYSVPNRVDVREIVVVVLIDDAATAPLAIARTRVATRTP